MTRTTTKTTTLPNGYSWTGTYDSNNNQLTHEDSQKYSWTRTYDSNNKPLTFRDSDGFSSESIYDSNGNELTYTASNGNKYEYEYNEQGQQTNKFIWKKGIKYRCTHDLNGNVHLYPINSTIDPQSI